jgi:hypothetical protein
MYNIRMYCGATRRHHTTQILDAFRTCFDESQNIFPQLMVFYYFLLLIPVGVSVRALYIVLAKDSF